MNNYIALYRKWRPQSFADVVGQEHITEVLSAEVLSGNVSHAYLFCGSRGTGKTTCAKIFSRAINCTNSQNGDPCGKCEACKKSESSFDIVEMDAASNNGVDEIRKLREEVLYPPTEMKKKVYIIDEVHMLSSSAFNALLKTLEEPPEHVVFILATTELNKIPVTILSRCKRFDFHRITPEKIFGRIKFIAETEKINITDDALKLISRLATGAMRDALSALEMFMGNDSQIPVDEKKAAETLGVMGKDAVLETVGAIASKNINKALEVVWRIYDSGKDLSVLCSECGEIFRDMLMIKYMSESKAAEFLKESAASAAELVNLADMFTSDRLIFCTEVLEETMQRLTRASFSRRTVFETALFKLCGIAVADVPETVSAKVSALEERLFAIEKAIRSGAFEMPANGTNTSLAPAKPAEISAPIPEQNVTTEFGDYDIPPEESSPFDAPFDVVETTQKVQKSASDNALSDAQPQKENDKNDKYSPYDDAPFDIEKPAETVKPVEPKAKEHEKQPEKFAPVAEVNEKETPKASGAENLDASCVRPLTRFNEVVGLLHEKDKMYISFLNNAKAHFSGNDDKEITLELAGFAFTFINASENKKKEIAEAMEKVLGYEVKLKIVAATASSASASLWSL